MSLYVITRGHVESCRDIIQLHQVYCQRYTCSIWLLTACSFCFLPSGAL